MESIKLYVICMVNTDYPVSLTKYKGHGVYVKDYKPSQ